MGKGGTRNGGRLHDVVAAYIARIPPWPYYTSTLHATMELVIEQAIQRYEEARSMGRKCKSAVVFQLAGSIDGEWLIMRGAFTTVARAAIVKKYGTDVRFANEEFAGQTAT